MRLPLGLFLLVAVACGSNSSAPLDINAQREVFALAPGSDGADGKLHVCTTTDNAGLVHTGGGPWTIALRNVIDQPIDVEIDCDCGSLARDGVPITENDRSTTLEPNGLVRWSAGDLGTIVAFTGWYRVLNADGSVKSHIQQQQLSLTVTADGPCR
jgi:hypothetical protein